MAIASIKKLLELDYMEYATDAAAQAAYATSDPQTADQIPDMTDNNAPSGLCSASSTFGAYYPYLAMNDTNSGEADCWYADGAKPQWLQYQFAAGKVIGAYSISARDYTLSGCEYPVAWTLQGSNNGSDWTNLDSQSGQSFTQAEKKTYVFINVTSYAYYRLTVTESQHSTLLAIGEFELILASAVKSYSEGTIKNQGSYSLKGVALPTDSVDETLTRTLSPVLDLSGKSKIRYDIYASRTGSNISLTIHDSGGATASTIAIVNTANTWERKEWDISGVADGDKDAIDQFYARILNADALNTFYIDNVRYK